NVQPLLSIVTLPGGAAAKAVVVSSPDSRSAPKRENPRNRIESSPVWIRSTVLGAPSESHPILSKPAWTLQLLRQNPARALRLHNIRDPFGDRARDQIGLKASNGWRQARQ